MGSASLIELVAVADTAIREARVLVGDAVFGVDGEVVAAARALVDQAELLCTLTVSRLSTGAGSNLRGGRDVGGWMAANTNARASEGPTRVAHAGLLSSFPCLGAAADDGRIGLAQIRMFASAFTTARVELAERDVGVLLGWAVTLPVIQFQDVIKQWESLCDDELGDTTGDDAVHQKRCLR
jgi:hypothetical protein